MPQGIDKMSSCEIGMYSNSHSKYNSKNNHLANYNNFQVTREEVLKHLLDHGLEHLQSVVDAIKQLQCPGESNLVCFFSVALSVYKLTLS